MKSGIRTTWKLLEPHAKRHLPAFGLLIALGWVSAAFQRSVVVLIYPTIDVLFPAKAKPIDPETWGASVLIPLREWIIGDALSGGDRMPALMRIAAILGAGAVLAAFAQYGFLVTARWIALRMVVDLRERIARHLMGLSMSYHGRRHFGDLLSRLSSDVTTTLSVLNQSLKDLVQEPLLALSSFVIAFAIAPKPALLVVVGLVIVAFAVGKQARRVRKGSSRSMTQLGSSVQALTQMFQGVRTVKAFRAEERELAAYCATNDGYVQSTMKMVRAQATSNATTLFVSHFGMAVMVLVVGLMVGADGFTDEKSMLAFFLSVAAVYTGMKDVVKAVTNVQESVGASERIQELLDEKPDVVERSNARVSTGLGDGIRFDGVTFRYPGGDGPALSSITLHVRPGETLALVGPSGSGKSTLVDLVARFIDPAEGRVLAGGVDLRDQTIDSWTSQFALVGQTPFLFHASIEENIRYGKPGASRAEVERAARMAGIHDFIEKLPEGYATNVADAGSRLSGGQRQRLTIARAFLKDAPLLLLDEATSALDTESEAVVQESLERLMSGKTVIVIAHRLTTIRNADRIAVLEGGRLVELGTHEELLARKGAYARLCAAA